MVVMVMVVMVMVVMVMVVMVMVVMVMAVMVMVVEMTIEKRGLMECMQYENVASFCRSLLHMVTPTNRSHHTSLMANVQGGPSQSIGSNDNTVVRGVMDAGYDCTEGLPHSLGQREWYRLKQDMTVGIITLAVDMRPEATLLIGLS
jgi:hypothetical protein